ncbi:TPA: tail fiber domain-containing protein, partial [Streptococcus pneumoniae]|nr:tail fiber domain-containing protein [Streptococcus pneumoniae]
MIAPYWYNPYNAGIPNAQNIQHGYFDTETFSDTVFAFNESDGSRHWKALSTDFKIGVISAGEYYFSADLYATDLGTHIKFGFYYHNSTGKLNFYAGRTKIEVTEKGRWTRLGIDLKVNDDIDLTKKVQFYIYGYNFASNSILYLKKPKVSKGRLKSDWSPALEDTDGL